ncbi:hypothetical protein LGV90_09230, partial [Streptococcus mutans]|nr:hypothetical protein [Streptococcus mutans]
MKRFQVHISTKNSYNDDVSRYTNNKKGRYSLNCTPKVRQKKSNFWGVFIMKLTYEDKVLIYELKNQG